MADNAEIPPDAFYCGNCESTNVSHHTTVNRAQCNDCLHRLHNESSMISPQRQPPSAPNDDYAAADQDYQDDDDDMTEFDQRIFDWMESIPTEPIDELDTDRQNEATTSALLPKKSTKESETTLAKQTKRLRKEALITTLTIPPKKLHKESLTTFAIPTTKPRNEKTTTPTSPVKMSPKAPAISTSVDEPPKEVTESAPSSSKERIPKESPPSADVTTNSPPPPVTPPSLTDNNTLFIPKRRRVLDPRPPAPAHQQFQYTTTNTSRSLKRPYSSYSSFGHSTYQQLTSSPLFSTISHDKRHDTTTSGKQFTDRPYEEVVPAVSPMPVRPSVTYSYSQQQQQQQQQQAEFPSPYQHNPFYSCMLPYSRYVPRDKSPLYSKHRSITRQI